jgi:hypothetical protein
MSSVGRLEVEEERKRSRLRSRIDFEFVWISHRVPFCLPLGSDIDEQERYLYLGVSVRTQCLRAGDASETKKERIPEPSNVVKQRFTARILLTEGY